MINGLRGKIIEKNEGFITIDVLGVCYKVFVSQIFLQNLGAKKSESEVYIKTYLSVRENALDLYGFEDEKDKDLFELLLTISGVGPKSALNIMNLVTRDMVEESIQKDDPRYLSKISGLGKKTAEKIVSGLKDKIIYQTKQSAEQKISGKNPSADSATAIDALVSLGYTERDARNTVKNMDTNNKNTEQIIKEALKNLS